MKRDEGETIVARVSKKLYDRVNVTHELTKLPKTQIYDMLADDKYWPFVLQKKR